MGINFQGVSSPMALLALQNFARKKWRFHGGVVLVTIASIRAVAARTGVPRWPRGAVCPQGVPCYGLVMEPRQPACNRRVAPGPTRTHFWLFYAILEVGARTSPLLYHVLLKSSRLYSHTDCFTPHGDPQWAGAADITRLSAHEYFRPKN